MSSVIRKKIFLTVLTYPLPSLSYDDSFCAAGFFEDGSMIRLYPLPFAKYRLLHKYSEIELDIKKRSKGDFRTESYSPADFNLKDLKILNKIDTSNEWNKRRSMCLNNVYYDYDKLLNDSKAPLNISLAVYKPKEIIDFIVEDDNREWKKSWIAKMNQTKIFEDTSSVLKLDKIPFKFKYHFIDNNKSHKLSILDWEAGVLYRNCLKSSDGSESNAIDKVRQKYLVEFKKRDVYFFLGTTLEWHIRRVLNPFVIIGVFYPPYPKEQPPSLF